MVAQLIINRLPGRMGLSILCVQDECFSTWDVISPSDVSPSRTRREERERRTYSLYDDDDDDGDDDEVAVTCRRQRLTEWQDDVIYSCCCCCCGCCDPAKQSPADRWLADATSDARIANLSNVENRMPYLIFLNTVAIIFILHIIWWTDTILYLLL